MSDWPEVEARLRRALQNTKRSPLKDVVSAGLVPALVDPADLLAALARIEALEGERAWRPISEAPMDACIIGWWAFSEIMDVVSFGQDEQSWVTDGDADRISPPTHWLSLPHPPPLAPREPE